MLDAKTKRTLKMEKFSDIYQRFLRKNLTTNQAAEYLGITPRHFLRVRKAYQDEGDAALIDRRLGLKPNNAAADAEVEFITNLYNERYSGYTVSHFYDFLQWEHSSERSYTWVKNKLINACLISPKAKGGAHRLRRPRREREGEMIHQDGSTHNWFGDEKCDLIITMDDATSKITSGFFCPQESTLSSLRGIKETIENHGLFNTFYTDRGSHYFFTPEAGGKVDKTRLTQVGRALKELKIHHIAAYSPQARGRSERMFKTLQDRLVKELKLNNITDMENANKYLRETFIPRHNRRFAVAPADLEPAFRIPPTDLILDDVLCIEHERITAYDNTVSYKGYKLQIPKNSRRYNYVKCPITIKEHIDGRLSLWHSYYKLTEFKGLILEPEREEIKAA